jgi:hypothetical protein
METYFRTGNIEYYLHRVGGSLRVRGNMCLLQYTAYGFNMTIAFSIGSSAIIDTESIALRRA